MTNALKKDDIELKHFTDSDAEVLFQLVDKNRKHIGRWLSWVPTMTSVDAIAKKTREWSKEQTKGTDETFGVWYEEALVGAISLNHINKLDKNAEIGYWLDENHQGKGIVTNSCKLLLAYGFKDLRLHIIEISCSRGNDKSRAITKRLGFTKEGTARESGLLNGEFVDSHWYSLLADEWKQ